jgi:uncharacterized protein (TIGR03089 family)
MSELDLIGGGTAARLLAAAVTADPAGPLLTYYDDATGERTELSAATLDNWVAKTANLLVDGHALGPGDRAAVLLPPHWQTAAVLLGCWSAGLTVSGTLAGGHVEIAFVAADRLDGARGGADEVYGLSLAPLAAPMRPGPPPGVSDYPVEVRAYGDSYSGPPTPPGPTAGAEPGFAGRAAALGIRAGDRVLIDAAAHPDPVDWLLAPLAAGASIVLCGHLDRAKLARRVKEERVTVTLAG